MKSYLKNYKVKLKTLAPVFIGSGKELSKAEYIFDGKQIYIVDEKKLMDIIVKKNLVNKYMESITIKSFNLKMWLDKNGIYDYKSLAAYTLSGIENVDNKHSLKGINTCIKNAYNQPYIPGSSLKGALRTVLLWNMIYDNYDSLNGERKYISSELKKDSSKAIKKEISKKAMRLEKRFLNKKIDNTDSSIMRGLIIGDSKPLSLDDIILCQKVDLNINGKENSLNILRECIKPDTEIEFDMTIDSSLFGLNADNMNEMLKNYSMDYFDIVTDKFKNGSEEENTVYLGGGAGYFSKTVTYSLYDMGDAVDFVKQYLAKTTPRQHKHRADRGISPHMQKCTKIGSKMYEMGKCRFEFVEV